jgi:putative ATP-binding cassette transporter
LPVLKLLSQVPKLPLTIAIFASALSGIAAMGATICVLEYFRSGEVLWWQFAVIALLAVAIGRYSRAALGQLGSRSVIRLRRRLIRSVLHVPLLDLERIGTTRLLVAFTSDVFSIGSAVRHVATLVASAAFLLAAMAYIGWLAPIRMMVAGVLCVLCIGGAFALRRLETRHRHSMREALDKVLHVYSMVLEGVKQLKLDRPLARRALLAFEDRVREQQRSAGRQSLYSDSVETWIQGMFYFILGVAVFGPFGDAAQLKVGFGIVALLQIQRPLRSLIVDTRALAEASVALQRIMELGFTLSGENFERDSPKQRLASSRVWRSLALESVTFKYSEGNADDNFVLGPLEMNLHPGEIVFVIGENGSGKTTFAKVLTGLYAPTSGTIRIDGATVNSQSIHGYRSKFAAVFGDYSLFEGVADLKSEDLDQEAKQVATWLKLNEWRLAAPASNGKSTTLSSGERPRIALLIALSLDRPILVCDEWASDQDPRYKDFFYHEILPRLRDSGKLIVVISHDEGYFHTADRVLCFQREQRPIWKSPSSFRQSVR